MRSAASSAKRDEGSRAGQTRQALAESDIVKYRKVLWKSRAEQATQDASESQ